VILFDRRGVTLFPGEGKRQAPAWLVVIAMSESRSRKIGSYFSYYIAGISPAYPAQD